MADVLALLMRASVHSWGVSLPFSKGEGGCGAAGWGATISPDAVKTPPPVGCADTLPRHVGGGSATRTLESSSKVGSSPLVYARRPSLALGGMDLA